tara:strand:- start:1432 stop:2100 length:669 start_codon:yes stop_codon:yes gene_type:complete
MLVFDMAGTTVNEGGIVYDTLYKTMKNDKLDVQREDIHKWHGSNKYEVLSYYFTKKYPINNIELDAYGKAELFRKFDKNLKNNYFNSSNIKLMNSKMPDLFNKIRDKNIKIVLNTGYNKEIQESIIDKLHMKEFIDDYISSEEVPFGRPHPYMIKNITEQHNISPRNVIKIGDTFNDILEGLNADCIASVGVLTGADNKITLEHLDSRAFIMNSIMDIEPLD